MYNFKCKFSITFQQFSINELTFMIKIKFRAVSKLRSALYFVNMMQMKFKDIESKLVLNISPMFQKRHYTFDWYLNSYLMIDFQVFLPSTDLFFDILLTFRYDLHNFLTLEHRMIVNKCGFLFFQLRKDLIIQSLLLARSAIIYLIYISYSCSFRMSSNTSFPPV